MVDIFEFWSQIGRGENVHPADRKVFDRMDPKRHGFRLDCLPSSFGGRLREAPRRKSRHSRQKRLQNRVVEKAGNRNMPRVVLRDLTCGP